MRLLIACTLAAGALAQVTLAQEGSPTYRLRFRLQESGTEVKTATTRNYDLIVQSKSRGKINASRRIPYYTSSKGEAKELHTAAVGSIIECSPEERETGVLLQCAFESGFIAQDQTAQPVPFGFLPLINNRQASTTAFVAIGPEVKLASMDDPSSSNRLEVFVTVERVSGSVGPNGELSREECRVISAPRIAPELTPEHS